MVWRATERSVWQKFGNRRGTSAVDGGDEISERRGGLGTECSHHIDELDDAQAPLTPLVLGNKRLVFAETAGDLNLCQTLALAQSSQLRAERDLARRAQGVTHGGEVKFKDSGPTA